MKKKCFFLIYIFFIILLIFNSISFADDISDDEIIDVNAELISNSANRQYNLKIPEINSRACVVIDRNTNTILYGKNENTKRKMASTTKILTATIIIENCNLNETIEISKKAASTGGSRLGLKSGDKITINDLLYGLMLRSGNDAAVALAEYAGGNVENFAGLMNNKASELGLKNSHFETPHGLDSEQHYTTAYELALLSNYALKNKTFSQIVGTKTYTISINGFSKTISNTNELLGNLNGVYGVKTGFTNGANRCLVTACRRENIDIICVVLGADTKKNRTQDSINLINYIFDNFESINIQEIINKEFEKWKKENTNSFIINKSITQNLNLNLESSAVANIPIRKDLKDTISINIECPTTFDAPIDLNKKIGTVYTFIDNKPFLKNEIYTSSQINKKNTFIYFLYFIKNFTQIIQDNI